MEENIGVALSRCYFCLEAGDIYMNTRLSKRHATAVEEMNGKVINMNPCSKCEELMKQGVLLISVKDDSEQEIRAAGDERRMPNPYRTGGWTVIKDKALQRILDPKIAEGIIARRWSFVPDLVWDSIGLPRGGKDE